MDVLLWEIAKKYKIISGMFTFCSSFLLLIQASRLPEKEPEKEKEFSPPILFIPR